MLSRSTIALITILGQLLPLATSAGASTDDLITRSFSWVSCPTTSSQWDTCTSLPRSDGATILVRRISRSDIRDDIVGSVTDYFVVGPNGSLRRIDKRILLGLRTAASSLGTALVTAAFPTPPGARADLDESLLQYLTYHLSERGTDYCMTYVARHPFSGEATFCDDAGNQETLRFTLPYLFPRLIAWSSEVLKANGLDPGNGIDYGPAQMELHVRWDRSVQLSCVWSEWLSAASPRNFRFTMDATSGELRSLDLRTRVAR